MRGLAEFVRRAASAFAPNSDQLLLCKHASELETSAATLDAQADTFERLCLLTG